MCVILHTYTSVNLQKIFFGNLIITNYIYVKNHMHTHGLNDILVKLKLVTSKNVYGRHRDLSVVYTNYTHNLQT